MYTDKFGVPLAVNDKVLYTTGAQGDTSIEVGTIDKLTARLYGGSTTPVAYLTSSRGRKLTNDRNCSCLVSIAPIKAQHPELFL